MPAGAPPRTAPERECDIVMKGGVTSGVVYPEAVMELARTYRFRAVGGTSAGAIAAAGAAAAELGRSSGGFERLAELPAWIARDGNLASLFQAQRRTQPLLAVLLALTQSGRATAVGTAVAGFPVAALAGAVPGLALAVLTLVDEGDGPALTAVALVGAVLLLVAGMAAAIGRAMWRRAHGALPANGFGLCSGMPGVAPRGRPALTPWLTELFDRFAGRETGPDDPPLTFGDLVRGPEGTGTPEEPWLRLEMVTTNLTNRSAQRVPWEGGGFSFDPGEWRGLFPERVVRWMEEHPPPLPDAGEERRRSELNRELMLPRRPLPAPADLPVVVATRMSLSFPVLLSAVPLWRVDYSLRANSEAIAAWRRWAKAGGDRPVARPVPEHCWFSDGGISSNFPVHFFDAFLPRRPTFAINLRPFRRDEAPSPDEAQNVTMTGDPAEDIKDWWYPFDGRLAGFLEGIVRTMQNRVDEAQMRVPGYRERVVNVSMGDGEGGLNLAMEPAQIERISARGRAAARLLAVRYAPEPPGGPEDWWDAHRWIRFRSTTAAVAELLRSFAKGYGFDPRLGSRTYAELVDRPEGEPPRCYALEPGQQAVAEDLTARILEAAARLDAAPAQLARRAPQPAPVARIVPQEGGAGEDREG